MFQNPTTKFDRPVNPRRFQEEAHRMSKRLELIVELLEADNPADTRMALGVAHATVRDYRLASKGER